MENQGAIIKYYTHDDYEQWEGEENSELIGGARYVMEPAPTLGHQGIAARLTSEFHFQLKNSRTYTVYQPLNYRIANDTILQPDMLVVCGEPGGLYLDSPPVLVAEILSPSTALRDRNIKFSLYQSQGVLYYLIVHPGTQEVEVYRWEEGKYVLKAKGKDIHYTFELAESNNPTDGKAEIDFSQIW
jgi:Uma2 family endonuclease